MERLRQRLSPEILDALAGRGSEALAWKLRSEESAAEREKLLEFFDTPSSLSSSDLLRFLREQQVPRELAEMILREAGIPIRIPAGAMNVLRLGRERIHERGFPIGYHVKDGSPLDWPVFLEKGTTGHLCWRRTDKPYAAVLLADGRWEWQSATY